MALTYMRHDEHGVIDVYDEASVETNQKNGWVIIDDYSKYHADLIAKKLGVAPQVKEELAAVPDWMNGASDTKRGPGRPRKDG